jgi:signal transduction histidine kinase
MTVPQRILFHVAAGVALVTAIATGVTYAMVHQSTRQRMLGHLDIYVGERARREEIGFRHVQANLVLVRGQFLKRMEAALPSDLEKKWHERFRLFPDGAWRSREEFSDGRKWSTLWAHKDARLTPEWQTQILRAQDICNDLLPGWVDAFPSVYFVLQGPANIGFDPRIPNWVWDTPGDYKVDDLEWYQLAMPKTKPGDGLSWTGVIEEPSTKTPIVSVYLPIELNGRFIGSVGHDLFVQQLMDETTRSDLPGAMHVIFRGDGRLIAHPTKRAEILATKGELRMENSGEPALARLYRAVKERPERRFSGYDAESGLYYSGARLAGPEWYFLTTVPRELVQQQAFHSAQWVLWSGLGSLALVVAVLATILRRQIAQPLAELSRATRQMGKLDTSARAVVDRSDEFGALAGAFNDMAARIAARGAELRQLNQDLEQRVKQRTAELTEANRRLDKGREEALRLLAQERELRELKSDFVSLVSHEFRTPLEIIMSSADNLQRYHDRLPPEKRTELLQTINKAVRRMSGMMEEALVLGRLETYGMKFKERPFDFHGFCRRVCDEIESATNRRCPIHLALDGTPEHANGDESIVRHIFTNLLSNAVKYSAAGQSVDFTVSCEGEKARFRVSDRGCGVPLADQKRLFQAFHRGSNVRQIPGTGLGLLIVRRCVELHRGTIAFTSTEGQGTTFTVELPLFAPPRDEA